MKISLKISLIASTIVLASFSAFSYFQFKTTESNLRQSIENNLNNTSVLLDYEVSNWLNGKLSAINLLAQTMTGLDNQKYKDIIWLKEGDAAFQLLYFADSRDGTLLHNDATLTFNTDERETHWYKQALANGSATLTDAYKDESSPFPMISAVAAVYSPGGKIPRGVVGGDINTEVVSNALNKINFDNAGYTFITNKSGRIVIHPNAELFNQEVSGLFASQSAIDLSKVETQEGVLKNGRQVLVKFIPIKGVVNSNWLLGIVIDKKIAHKDIDQMMINALIGTLVAVVLCILLIYAFMNRVVIHPMVSLTESAVQISMGKMSEQIDEKYLARNDEVGKLAEGFERMRKSLNIAFSKISKMKGH